LARSAQAPHWHTCVEYRTIDTMRTNIDDDDPYAAADAAVDAARDEVDAKFLKKLVKGTKGGVDMDVATRVINQIPGWSIEPTVTTIEAWRQYGVGTHLDRKAGLQDPRNRYHSILSVNRDWNREGTKELKTISIKSRERSDVEAARGVLELLPPSDAVRPGGIYVERIGDIVKASDSSGRWTLPVGQMWIGAYGWNITAPNGKQATITSKGLSLSPGPAFDEMAPLWTFVYKNGIAKDAQARIDLLGSDVVERASMSKVARARDVARRQSLPEIQAVFREITDRRFAEVVDSLTNRYIAAARGWTTYGKIYDKMLAGENTTRFSAENATTDFLVSSYGMLPVELVDKRGNNVVMKEYYVTIANRLATKDAEEGRKIFVEKNTERISAIARRKSQPFRVQILRERDDQGVAGYGGDVKFTFDDGSSFTLRNKTIYKRSTGGRFFMQFPTTFHDVKMPDGSKMPSPSEARMLDVFAGNAPASNPASRRQHLIADRLANP